MFSVAGYREFDRPAIRRVLDGVVDQVLEDALKAFSVRIDVHRMIGSVQHNRMTLREPIHHLDNWAHECSQIVGIGPEYKVPRLERLCVGKRSDQRRCPRAGRLDSPE